MGLKEKYQRTPKWLKVCLWITLVVLLLTLLLWLALTWYISNHKDQLKEKIETALSEQLNGDLHMEDMEPVLWRSFPNVSVRVQGILLTDSLYAQHKRPTVQLQSLYVKINVPSILTGKPKIANIELSDGFIHLFTDTSGYSNLYLFKKKRKKDTAKNKLSINNFDLTNVQFIFDHHQRNKQFKIDLNNVHGRIQERGNITKIKLRLNTFVHQLGFNLVKGGFLTNKKLKGTLQLSYDSIEKTLDIAENKLDVNGVPVFYSATFYTGKKPVTFTMLIKSSKLPYDEGISMLSRHISSKLEKIKVKDLIKVQTFINGAFTYPDTPTVNVFFETKNNEVTTSYGKLDKATFAGTFTNYYKEGAGKADNNSALMIPKLTGEWEDIPLRIDSVSLLTTLHPLLSCHIQSDFPVERLNNLAGNTFDMKGGKGSIDLKYRGPINPTDTHEYYMTGNILLQNVALTYLPRSLSFQNSNVNIEFTGKDLYLRNTQLSTQRSTINLNGVATDFMKIYFTDPGKVVFNWTLTSKLIDLNEFRSFLSSRKSALPISSKKKRNRRVVQFNQQLDKMLDESSMYLKIDIDEVTYRKFNARAVKADLAFKKEAIDINNVHLRHAEGRLDADIQVKNSASGTPFQVNAKVNQVNVAKLFESFENFGQQAIADTNLTGKFSATVDISGRLQESGNLVKNSLNGRVDFKLADGALINFKPLLQIQKFVFKRRNLQHVTFKTLEDRLDIHQGKIKIYPMLIESSALNMKVQGIYALGPGTDISLEIPLRDPQKDIDRVNQGLAPKKKKGIIVYLRATDGEDGKVHISWDPFKKGLDSTDEISEVDLE